jgi:branched-chain amino acid transport system permease protein
MQTFKNYRSSYLEDRALVASFPDLSTKVWLSLGLIALLTLPPLLPQYWLYTINLAIIAIVGAFGLNLLTGYAGQISLAHASFLAIGAFVTAYLAKLDMPFFLVLPIAGGVAAALGCIVALPALRLKGLYLALATLAFFVIVDFLLRKMTPLTGGAAGTHVPPPKVWGSVNLSGDRAFYYLFLSVALIVGLFMANLERTWVGRAVMAVRDSDIAAEMAGISILKTKMMAFAISSFVGGLAGSMMGYYLQFINPDNFNLHLSVAYIAMIIVGGMGTVLGSILGALFMVFLPELLRVTIHFLSGHFPALDMQSRGAFVEGVVYGLVIMGFLMFKPLGLVQFWRDLVHYFRTWPFNH